VLASALLWVAIPMTVIADDYPDRPVTFVVGFGVGGSTDRMARAMSTFIADALGQPVQVINKRGAGTLLAANYMLHQPHDGYTVFASSFSPYLANTILEGNADYAIEDFAYLNFQWFEEDIIALNKDSEYSSLPELLEDIRENPKTVRAAVVRGSAGHLMARLLLEVCGIPPQNLNLVAYNSGGLARAAVAGEVVDFIIISAEGSESIRDYIRPLAIVSSQRNPEWDTPTLTEAMASTGIEVPVLPGSIRGFGTTAKFKRDYPERFDKLALAIKMALENQETLQLLERASIGSRWIGPEQSESIMRETFAIFRNYSYLLKQ
jgi:putative tricarboxylic transport membrane protein